jgi:hypothetical protein
MTARLDTEEVPPPPKRAYDAADALVLAGEHVHFVADGETSCYSGHCPVSMTAPGPIGAARFRQLR